MKMPSAKYKVLIWFVCFFVNSSSTAFSKSEDRSLSDYINLKLTHTIYAVILGSYFAEGDLEYRPRYLADKIFLQTFLSNWSEMIESEKYSSTKDIFTEIKQRKTYLGKYSSIWFNFHDPKQKNKINFGYLKNQFLDYIYRSEEQYQSLDDRILAILQAVKFYLLTSSNDYVSSELIARPFLESERLEIKEYAQGIIDGIPVQKKFDFALNILNLIAGGRTLTAGPGRLNL
ncbi:MAG: hypothetical protein K1X29_10975 [Bdellovibrionales bacterium]|nr:hypothetical protein [Bdellovibrionales bacterium]